MSGLNMTTMTLDDMRVARERGESKTDWVLLHQHKLSGIEPEDDEQSPDVTAFMREKLLKCRAQQPQGVGAKEQIAIGFDTEVLEAFRATGKGWQTRMNDVLRAWLREHVTQ